MEGTNYDLTVGSGKLITELKVLELKAELESRGLNKYGNKKELLERLRAYLSQEQQQQERSVTSASGQPAGDSDVEVPNPWFQQEANLENDFIREYFKSQQALFRQQIEKHTAGNSLATASNSSAVSADAPTPPVPQQQVISVPAVCTTAKKRGRKKKIKDQEVLEPQITSSPSVVDSFTAYPAPHHPLIDTNTALHNRVTSQKFSLPIIVRLKASPPSTSGILASSVAAGITANDEAKGQARPSRSSARTSRALSRVSLEAEDEGSSTPPLLSTPPVEGSPPRYPTASLLTPTLLNALTIKITKDDTLLADNHHHHSRKKHKKRSKFLDKQKIPSLKIRLPSESGSLSHVPVVSDEDDVDRVDAGGTSLSLPVAVKDLSEDRASAKLSKKRSKSSRRQKKEYAIVSELSDIYSEPSTSEVLPIRVSPCSASPQNSEVSSSIQDIVGGEHFPHAPFVTSPKDSDLVLDARGIPQSSQAVTTPTSPSSKSQWRKSKRLIADRSETATRRLTAAAYQLAASPYCVPAIGQQHPSQQSPDTSDRSNLVHQEELRHHVQAGKKGPSKKEIALKLLEEQQELERLLKSKQEQKLMEHERELKEMQERESLQREQELTQQREQGMKGKQKQKELQQKKEQELRDKNELREKNLQEKQERQLRAEQELKLQERRENELKDKRERELKDKRERELKDKRERELKEKCERELKEKCERELREKCERELREKCERELREKCERELREKCERELREKCERELREKCERELREKRERELKEKREREFKEKCERELKEKCERELKEKRERELREKRERELREKRERELREKHERELKEKREEELRIEREQELRRKQDQELKEKQQQELKVNHEREQQEKHEREQKEKHEREQKEKHDREQKEKEKHKREQQEKQEREAREKQELELREKRDRQLNEDRERELQRVQKEIELRTQQERALMEQQEREKRTQELKVRRDAEFNLKRELELKLKHEHDLELELEREVRLQREQNEKSRREQELLRKREELENKLKQSEQKLGLPPSQEKAGKGGAKRQRSSKKKRQQQLLPPVSAAYQQSGSSAWPPSHQTTQVIEGNLTLQQEVRVPSTLDLIVSQVTCSLTEETVPHMLHHPSSSSIPPIATGAAQAGYLSRESAPVVGGHVASVGRISHAALLPTIKSPDRDSLVSLKPVSQSSLQEHSFLRVRSDLSAIATQGPTTTTVSPITTLSLGADQSLYDNVITTAASVEKFSKQSQFHNDDVKHDSHLPETGPLSRCFSPERTCSVTSSSINSSSMGISSSSKPFSSPASSGICDEDPQLASEVQDATYYLVKELQEQDSSYGHRRRSLDEAVVTTSDCTSTSIYCGGLTSPPLTPRLLSPNRFLPPSPHPTRTSSDAPDPLGELVASTGVLTCDSFLASVVSPNAVTSALASLKAPWTSPEQHVPCTSTVSVIKSHSSVEAFSIPSVTKASPMTSHLTSAASEGTSTPSAPTRATLLVKSLASLTADHDDNSSALSSNLFDSSLGATPSFLSSDPTPEGSFQGNPISSEPASRTKSIDAPALPSPMDEPLTSKIGVHTSDKPFEASTMAICISEQVRTNITDSIDKRVHKPHESEVSPEASDTSPVTKLSSSLHIRSVHSSFMKPADTSFPIVTSTTGSKVTETLLSKPTNTPRENSTDKLNFENVDVPVSKPVDFPALKLSDDPVSNSSDVPVSSPADVSVSSPADVSVSSPADVPVSSLADVPVSSLADVPVSSLADVPVSSLADVPVSSPADDSVSKPYVDVSIPKPADVSISKLADWKPVDVSVSRPVDVSVSRPADVSVFKPADVSVSKPVDVSVSKPADVSVSKPADVSVSKPADVSVSKPADVSVSKPADVSVSKPADVSVSKPADVSVSKPADGSVSKPADGSVSKPADGSVSKPADGSVSKPADGSVSKPADGSVSKPADVSVSKPADVSVSKPADVSVSKPADVSVSKPADGSVSKPADGSVSKPADGSVSKPADGSVSKPADGSVSKPADGSVSKPADGSVSKPADVSLSKPADVSLSNPADVSLSNPADVSLSNPADVSLTKPADVSVSKPAVVFVSKPADVSVSKPADVSVSKPADVSVSKPADVSVSKPADVSVSKPADVSVFKPAIVSISKSTNESALKIAATKLSGTPFSKPTDTLVPKLSDSPASKPSDSPASKPSDSPASKPSGSPASKPSGSPASKPSGSPASKPSGSPASKPSGSPASKPSGSPASKPSGSPASKPSGSPASKPSGSPASKPSGSPASKHSGSQASKPSDSPASKPSDSPASKPSDSPASNPSDSPASKPPDSPASKPSDSPASKPSDSPASKPSDSPASKPSDSPASKPAVSPASKPADSPASKPTDSPASKPADSPASKPADSPASKPADSPASKPADSPASKPSDSPVSKPSDSPVSKPSDSPVTKPSDSPVSKPSDSPVSKPSDSPVSKPSDSPASKPSDSPASKPSDSPVSKPSDSPVLKPSDSPASKPSDSPASKPSDSPASKPSDSPASKPSDSPASKPSDSPVPKPVKLPVTSPSHTPVGTFERHSASSISHQASTTDLVAMVSGTEIVGRTSEASIVAQAFEFVGVAELSSNQAEKSTTDTLAAPQAKSPETVENIAFSVPESDVATSGTNLMDFYNESNFIQKPSLLKLPETTLLVDSDSQFKSFATVSIHTPSITDSSTTEPVKKLMEETTATQSTAVLNFPPPVEILSVESIVRPSTGSIDFLCTKESPTFSAIPTTIETLVSFKSAVALPLETTKSNVSLNLRETPATLGSIEALALIRTATAETRTLSAQMRIEETVKHHSETRPDATSSTKSTLVADDTKSRQVPSVSKLPGDSSISKSILFKSSIPSPYFNPSTLSKSTGASLSPHKTIGSLSSISVLDTSVAKAVNSSFRIKPASAVKAVPTSTVSEQVYSLFVSKLRSTPSVGVTPMRKDLTELQGTPSIYDKGGKLASSKIPVDSEISDPPDVSQTLARRRSVENWDQTDPFPSLCKIAVSVHDTSTRSHYTQDTVNEAVHTTANKLGHTKSTDCAETSKAEFVHHNESIETVSTKVTTQADTTVATPPRTTVAAPAHTTVTEVAEKTESMVPAAEPPDKLSPEALSTSDTAEFFDPPTPELSNSEGFPFTESTPASSLSTVKSVELVPTDPISDRSIGVTLSPSVAVAPQTSINIAGLHTDTAGGTVINASPPATELVDVLSASAIKLAPHGLLTSPLGKTVPPPSGWKTCEKIRSHGLSSEAEDKKLEGRSASKRRNSLPGGDRSAPRKPLTVFSVADLLQLSSSEDSMSPREVRGELPPPAGLPFSLLDIPLPAVTTGASESYSSVPSCTVSPSSVFNISDVSNIPLPPTAPPTMREPVSSSGRASEPHGPAPSCNQSKDSETQSSRKQETVASDSKERLSLVAHDESSPLRQELKSMGQPVPPPSQPRAASSQAQVANSRAVSHPVQSLRARFLELSRSPLAETKVPSIRNEESVSCTVSRLSSEVSVTVTEPLRLKPSLAESSSKSILVQSRVVSSVPPSCRSSSFSRTFSSARSRWDVKQVNQSFPALASDGKVPVEAETNLVPQTSEVQSENKDIIDFVEASCASTAVHAISSDEIEEEDDGDEGSSSSEEEHAALSENSINMGRTTKRRSVSNSSAAAGDTENSGTPSARRSARKTKTAGLAIEEEKLGMPEEEEGCAGAENGEEKPVERDGSTPNGADQPKVNGDEVSEVQDTREVKDGEAVPEQESNPAVSHIEQSASSPRKGASDSKNSDATAGQDAAVSSGATDGSSRAERQRGTGGVSPAQTAPRGGRASSRSRSVDKEAPVRRSRRLSRGSSVEPSDDEGVNLSVSVAAQAVADKLHTIVEAGETPEKKHPVAAVKESPPSSAPPTSQMEVTINSVGADDGVVKASRPEEDEEEDMPHDTIKLTVETSEILDKFDDSDEEEKDEAVHAPVAESPKKENTETAKLQSKQDTPKESAVSKRRNRSTSTSRSPPRKRGRGSRRHSSSSSSESRSRSDDRQRRRRRPSDADKDSSSARGSAKKKPSLRDSIAGDDRKRLSRSRSPQHSSSKLAPKSSQKDRSSKRSTPVSSRINASGKSSVGGGTVDRHSSSSTMKSPSSSKKGRLSPPHSPSSERRRYNKISPSTELRKKKSSPDHIKRKHSPIILRGLADEQDSPTKMPRVNSTDNAVAKEEKSDTKEAEDKENKEQVDDFDYASFKSSRRVSLSKKLRDPTNDKHRRDVMSKLGGVIGKKEEPTIEISSQSLRTLIPDVQPLSESELKLDDSDEEVEAGRRGKEDDDDDDDSAGSLSDGELRELRERQMLLQKKLKGLEEKDGASSADEEGGKEAAPKTPGSGGKKKKKKKAVENNGYRDEVGHKDEDEFSDAEEEEKALRRAAQQSMKKKIAKKEEFKRKLSKEDEKPDKKKTKKLRDGSPVQKKVRDDGSAAPRAGARAIEGPVVVVRKGPSIAPARNPTSCVVIIKNLTRPFTLRQLQALLQRTGRIVQGGFWVDSIKSVCIARFETEDQAEETRMHLHGIQWPGSNPKTLFVDFTTEVELERRMEECGSSLPPAQEQPRRKAAGAAAVREWDRVKLGERSPGEREREREVERRRRREEEEERELQRVRGGAPTGVDREEDGRHPHQEAGGRETGKYARKEIAAVAAAPERPQPKSLDDLFKKTKAKPSIYWLPLNKEQIAEKEALRRKLMAENEKQLAALKLKHEQEKQDREKLRLERDKQREIEKEKERVREKERAAAAAKRRSRSRSRKRSNKRSPRRSSRSRRSVSRSSSRRSRRRSRS